MLHWTGLSINAEAAEIRRGHTDIAISAALSVSAFKKFQPRNSDPNWPASKRIMNGQDAPTAALLAVMGHS